MQAYKRCGVQAGLSLDIMSRQAMLQQLRIESDYIHFEGIHELIDITGIMKSKIFGKKEAVLPLFSSFHKKLVKIIEFLDFDDRKFLETVLKSLNK